MIDKDTTIGTIESLYQQIELLQNRVEITSKLLNQETELKLSCFSYLIRTNQYGEWERFRKHEKMLRNQYGEEEKQRELWEFEKKVAGLIEEGFITNFDSLLAYLRRVYHMKSTPNVFIS